ncbi:hypothetical protein GGTG_03565 [Gaeumannomyces tritici R3-111a-1]|uniref:DNA repair protein Rad26 n=1 Tax=Gaeumannomyces tritici (strain R3-111a-1) TaxID=644352 RepID=J3NQK9_GAET3|nr:hypothetical protein GGTG_03565 [Gaeumannomyces tritici R3-111a-1]EJT78465.1 hypothetical protein GGTG_03565 [Gaeumannomyces tritici R3-111a-1]
MDDFSDDGFDELNDTVLQELENNAIQLTQAQTFKQTQAPPQRAGHLSHLDAEDEDLDDSVVFDELAQQPAHPLPTQQKTLIIHTVHGTRHYRPQWNQPPTNQQRPSHPAATLSSRPRYPGPPQLGKPRGTQATNGQAKPFQRPPPPRPIPPARPAAGPSVAPPRFAPPPSTGRPLLGNFSTGIASQAVPHAPPGSQSDNIIASLQARLNSLQNELTTAKGEAALLRNKFQGAQEAHEADLDRIRKQNADQLARQERIAERALAAEKTVTTELHFARQDLREERGVRTRKGKKNKDKDVGGATTPKKGASAKGAAAGASRSNWAIPDGFDDVELMPSPSKAAARRAKDPGSQPPSLFFGERTPSKGKRKRPAVDSPLLGELEMEMDGSSVKDELGASSTRPGSLPFDFLTLVLDHGALHDRPLTFELFYRYSFPSDQAQTFGSLIFSKVPLLGSPQDPIRLLIDFCLLIIELWRRCLEEMYYEPIYDLVALVSFTLRLRTVQVAPHIVAYLLPIAQSTVNLVAVPRFDSVDGDLSSNPDPGVQRVLASVDTTPILGLMYLAALGCAGAPPDLVDGQDPASPLLQYWTMIQPEFILALLSPKQKPDDFLGALALLSTSALQSSLGPVVLDNDPSKDVHVIAEVLISRISYSLSDPPCWVPKRSRRMCEVKLAALQTLIAFARTSFGLAKLTQSDRAIPRLVTVLSVTLDMLYDMEIPTSAFPLDDLRPAPSRELPPQDEPQDPNVTQEDLQAGASVPSKESPGAGAAIDAAPIPVSTEDNHPPTALLHAIISASVLLLHTVVTAIPSEEEVNDAGVNSSSNVAAKLAAWQGGSQRYLLTLARINFAEEDLVLEAGIDSETAELANELLELAVTPDEGEGVRNVFGFEETYSQE